MHINWKSKLKIEKWSQVYPKSMNGIAVVQLLSRILNSCPLSQWCHQIIQSAVTLFSYSQSFSAGSFPVNQLFASGGQNIGASVSASVLPMSIQGWLSLGLAGLISFQSKGLSRVFSSTKIKKHQVFGTHPSSWLNSHIRTWLWEKP